MKLWYLKLKRHLKVLAVVCLPLAVGACALSDETLPGEFNGTVGYMGAMQTLSSFSLVTGVTNLNNDARNLFTATRSSYTKDSPFFITAANMLAIYNLAGIILLQALTDERNLPDAQKKFTKGINISNRGYSEVDDEEAKKVFDGMMNAFLGRSATDAQMAILLAEFNDLKSEGASNSATFLRTMFAIVGAIIMASPEFMMS